MPTKRTRALDISPKVKRAVWERDGGLCVNCGTWMNTMPNAHYIPRSRGGLGIEENIVTMCRDCHDLYDNGSHGERSVIGSKLRDHLINCYPGWDETKLYYSKGERLP